MQKVECLSADFLKDTQGGITEHSETPSSPRSTTGVTLSFTVPQSGSPVTFRPFRWLTLKDRRRHKPPVTDGTVMRFEHESNEEPTPLNLPLKGPACRRSRQEHIRPSIYERLCSGKTVAKDGVVDFMWAWVCFLRRRTHPHHFTLHQNGNYIGKIYRFPPPPLHETAMTKCLWFYFLNAQGK